MRNFAFTFNCDLLRDHFVRSYIWLDIPSAVLTDLNFYVGIKRSFNHVMYKELLHWECSEECDVMNVIVFRKTVSSNTGVSFLEHRRSKLSRLQGQSLMNIFRHEQIELK